MFKQTLGEIAKEDKIVSGATKKYFIPSYGSDKETVILGKKLMIEIVQESEIKQDAILLIPTKGNADSTTIPSAFGSDVIGALLKNRHVGIPNGGCLKLESEKTFRNPYFKGTILCVYPTKKMLNAVDEIREAYSVIVVPWIEEEHILEWKKAWNPIVYGEKTRKEKMIIDNPVVVKAMEHLTLRINLSTGLLHSSDKASAVQLFKLLVSAEEYYDPSAIRAWALKNDWSPDGADRLKEVASGILDGKRYRVGSRKLWRADYIDVLRDETKKD